LLSRRSNRCRCKSKARHTVQATALNDGECSDGHSQDPPQQQQRRHTVQLQSATESALTAIRRTHHNNNKGDHCLPSYVTVSLITAHAVPDTKIKQQARSIQQQRRSTRPLPVAHFRNSPTDATNTPRTTATFDRGPLSSH
jgi:hypothetical protein